MIMAETELGSEVSHLRLTTLDNVTVTSGGRDRVVTLSRPCRDTVGHLQPSRPDCRAADCGVLQDCQELIIDLAKKIPFLMHSTNRPLDHVGDHVTTVTWSKLSRPTGAPLNQTSPSVTAVTAVTITRHIMWSVGYIGDPLFHLRL